MWFVYILKCKNGSFYTGVTNNLEKRVNAHNSGTGATYTRNNRPCVLMWKEKHINRSSAQKREWEIKKMTHIKKDLLVSNKIE